MPDLQLLDEEPYGPARPDTRTLRVIMVLVIAAYVVLGYAWVLG